MTPAGRRRWWWVLAALPLAALCAAGCGGAGTRTGQHVATASAAAASAAVALPRPETYTDPDLDSDIYPGEADPEETHVFGHHANRAETRTVARLVARYYAALAAGDGATACRMLYVPLAESLPETYGHGGAPAAGGESCAVAAARVFKGMHGQLHRQHRSLHVGAVRVRNKTASVRLDFGQGRAQYLVLTRERGTWKVSRLIASEQPAEVE